MFVKLSCKIADRLEHCGIISKSNRTLYEYGLRQMFATILNILTMLLIGFIMGLAVPAMVYTIAYIPLRVYAGGYHASTPQRCWAFSAIMLWIALCIVKYTPQMYFWVITTLSLIACIVVFLLSPVEDRNKRLDEKEHHVYHIRAIVVMTIEIVVSILIPCIPGLILICFHIQKSGILSASQIFSKKKKVPKNQHFFTHHPYFLDINTTHSTCNERSDLISKF